MRMFRVKKNYSVPLAFARFKNMSVRPLAFLTPSCVLRCRLGQPWLAMRSRSMLFLTEVNKDTCPMPTHTFVYRAVSHLTKQKILANKVRPECSSISNPLHHGEEVRQYRCSCYFSAWYRRGWSRGLRYMPSRLCDCSRWSPWWCPTLCGLSISLCSATSYAVPLGSNY